MSSLRKAAPRRTHKERSQPQARQHLGLLEKKKDYVLRARDYHRKEDTLLKLKQKAAFRNPDEFYFGMINSKTNKGQHILERNEKFDHETQQLMKTQDLNYVQYQQSINKKKIEKLKEGIHIIDESAKPNHTLYVDTEEEIKNFDVVEHFETVPALKNRTVNRIRKKDLESVLIADQDLTDIVKQREKRAIEIEQRIERDEKLDTARMEMEMQKKLMGKGQRRKIGTDKKGLPVYKWTARRSK
ncbi:UTP11-like, U3 small nucleolar ribonucleoprotein [Boothiomyces sp. JEL0866]|nr:UTP11-like, U3 small nucleolar ribonucleoprotein [Boothiomyces sp. JEL0866]